MTREDLKKFDLPDESGIYKFLDERGVILYIGKAASLRDRVRSYFAHDLAETRSTSIAAMIERTASVQYERTDSVLEALILEAALIKKHQPFYNTDERDNKSYNYLVITKEAFPRILVVRGRELFTKWSQRDIKYQYGPFIYGGALKEALKLVRKIFPYRDTCTPGNGTPCFNSQIGLCPGVCNGNMSETEYKEVVRNIVELFAGRMRSLKRRLESEMKAAAKRQDFEHANVLKTQVYALSHIRDVSLIRDEFRDSTGGSLRIEAYDVAHTAGNETVGVMTVVAGGEAHKQEYRKFKIRTVTNNDVAALAEVVERRLTHNEWQLPRLMVVDGSIAQMRSAQRILKKAGVEIPIVGIVKDEFHRPVRIVGDEKLIKTHEKDILLANSEAHRYAISWHRKRLTKSLRS